MIESSGTKTACAYRWTQQPLSVESPPASPPPAPTRCGCTRIRSFALSMRPTASSKIPGAAPGSRPPSRLSAPCCYATFTTKESIESDEKEHPSIGQSIEPPRTGGGGFRRDGRFFGPLVETTLMRRAPSTFCQSGLPSLAYHFDSGQRATYQPFQWE